MVFPVSGPTPLPVPALGSLLGLRGLAASLTSPLARSIGGGGPGGLPAWAAPPGAPGGMEARPSWAGIPGGPGPGATPGGGAATPAGQAPAWANQSAAAGAAVPTSGPGSTVSNSLPALPAQAVATLARALGAATAPPAGSGAAPFAAAPGQGGGVGPGTGLPAAPAALPAAGLPTPSAASLSQPQATLPAALVARADGAVLPQAAPPAPQATIAGSTVPAAARTLPLSPAQAQVALADRAAVAGPVPLPTAPNAPAAAPPGTPVATALAAPAAGNPQAANPASMPAPAAPLAPAHAEARGNPMLAGGPAQGRTDAMAQPHGHTVTAAARRSRLGDASSGRGSGVAHALALFDLAQMRRKLENELRDQSDRAFQRLYWLLTLTACVCAAVMALVIVVPMSGVLADASPLVRRNPLAWIGALSAVGLCAGLAAWWLARRTR